MSATTSPEPLLIGEIFRRNAEVVPERAAVSLGDELLTHAELDRAGNCLAWSLREAGVRHGDRVVCWADTGLEVIPLFVALARLGAAFAPISARLGSSEAEALVRLARPSLVVGDSERAAPAADLAKRLGVGTHVLGTDALGTRDEPIDEPALRETDPHVVFFTSGSTGAPKGVVLSHRANWLRSFQGVFRDTPEISLCMFPLFHMAAFTLGLAAWQTRGELVLVRNATPEEILSGVERRRANRLYCIPAVWGRILAADLERYDTSSLRELDTGTSATPLSLIHALKERFPGTVTRVYYGSTEVGSATTLSDADVLRKPGSVGPASPGVDLRLDASGEICVRSAYLIDGYFDNPEATAAALREGWFHTGDLGAFDDDGYLSIVGRLKEIIRTGGESVVPAEVEAVLASHPSVQEVAVVGVPDTDWGEVVCAVVVPAPGATPDLGDLQAHCEAELAGFKKPRRLECRTELPRTAATGQVQRALIVQQITSGVTA